MLKFTGVEIELIRDMEIYNFFQHNIRGGLTYCATKLMVADLPHLPNYKPENPRLEVRYFDARALYSHCLCKSLPIGGYTWLSEAEISDFKIGSISEDSEIGYVLEVDVSFPVELHDYFRDSTPLPQHMKPVIWQAGKYT